MKDFDQASRAAIRRTLIQYMKKHDIGVTLLMKRLAAALPGDIEVSQSTMQRFLANKRRTEDMHVGAISRFLDAVEADDVDGDVGQALSAFYRADDGPDYAGTFLPVEKGAMLAAERTWIIERDEGFWRATVKGTVPHHQVAAGILVDCVGTALVTLKDVLTGLPVAFILRLIGDELRGVGIFAPFSAGTEPPKDLLSSFMQIEAKRGPKGASDVR